MPTDFFNSISIDLLYIYIKPSVFVKCDSIGFASVCVTLFFHLA